MSSPPKLRLTVPKLPEHKLQIECSNMLRILMLPDVCWTAVDHGHSFNPTIGRGGQPIGLLEMQLRKARGVHAGISDYLFWRDSKGYAIELKTRDGVLSDPQKEFHAKLGVAHVPVAVCRSHREVADALTGWGLLRSYQETA